MDRLKTSLTVHTVYGMRHGNLSYARDYTHQLDIIMSQIGLDWGIRKRMDQVNIVHGNQQLLLTASCQITIQ